MWSQNKPLCSLYDWAEVIGIHPYLVAQIGVPSAQLATSFGSCERPFFQQSFMGSDTLSRNDVADALIQAQDLLAKLTNTMPAPFYHSEPIQYPRPANLRLSQMWAGSTGRLKPVKTLYGNIIAVGQYEETLLDADAPITPSDPYGDGFNTLGTLTVAVPAGTLESEVVCYFSAADIPDPLERLDCEVRPVHVSISGLTATITLPLILAVKLTNYLKLVPVTLSATDSSIYAATLDVYRRTVDLGAAGTLIWHTDNPCDEPPCEIMVSTGCFKSTDPRLGWVTPVPASFDEEALEWQAIYPETALAPDRVEVNYISGIPLVNHRLHPLWRSCVAKLATALLPNKALGCADADLRLGYYRRLPVSDDGTLEVTQANINGASAAFGVAGRGAIQAYNVLNNNHFLIGQSAHA